jgi:hypothetical protein
MMPAACEKEEAVLRAARLEAWSEELRRHAASCQICGSVALAVRFMRIGADDHAGDHPLPDPGRIWWQAQIRARRETAARATQPIAFVETGAWIGGIAALVSALAWSWPTVRAWIVALGSSLTGLTATGQAPAGPGLGTLLGLWSLPALITLAVYQALRVEKIGRRT